MCPLVRTIDHRFDVFEGKVDSVAHRIDEEVEQRHLLGERVKKLVTLA